MDNNVFLLVIAIINLIGGVCGLTVTIIKLREVNNKLREGE